MARSGWSALVVTILLVAGLGSEAALDAALDADRQVSPLLEGLTRFPSWSPGAMGFDDDVYLAIAAKVAVLLLVVVILARAAGNVGASFAAFLAGWAALMIGGAVAGVTFVVVADSFALDGQLADASGSAAAAVVEGMQQGLVFGLYTGWLVGLVVVLTARRDGAEGAAGWESSLGRELPVPGGVAGAGAAATAAAAMSGPGTDPMAGMNLVPGMTSVSTPGRGQPAVVGAGPEPDPWPPRATGGAGAWPDPGGIGATSDAAWAPQPASTGPEEDPWGAQPLSDPAVRSAPAGSAAATSAPTAGSGPLAHPGAWAAPPEPDPSTEGQPFLPAGSRPRPFGGDTGVEGPIVPSGSWPPSAQQPEPPALGQSASEPMLAPQPSPPTAGQPVDPAQLDNRIDTGQIPRPLWPSKWPAASTGNTYNGVPDQYTADQVKRLSPEETAVTHDPQPQPPTPDADPTADHPSADTPDDANTRFW